MLDYHEIVGCSRRRGRRRSRYPRVLDVLTRRPDADRAALIGRLPIRADDEWLAELLIDLEGDEPARLYLIAALREIR